MYCISPKIRIDLDQPNKLFERLSRGEGSADRFECASSAEGLSARALDQIPSDGGLIRSPIVDAVFDEDGTIREFRIGSPRPIQ